VVIASSEDDGERCAALLENGIDLVRPAMLGLVSSELTFKSDPKSAADRLSQWLRRPDCREAVPTEPLSDAGKARIATLLGQEGLDRLVSERLTPFDAGHIRDALLDFATADNLSRGAERDIDRVMRLFEYVARTISPEATGTASLPLTAYEAELFGRGSAEDRAWLFASLARQLRTDAVILRPHDATDADPWWVAVLAESGIYLFDTSLGVPVPAPDQSAGELSGYLPPPATWAQAVEKPALLVEYRQQAGLDAKPIDAERLKSPQVELIGPSSFWKLAMERLELSLTEDRGVLLYDPLQNSTQAGPGVFDRVASAGGSFWNADAITVWPYTEEIRATREDLSESDQERLRQRVQPYLGPVDVDTKGPAPVAEQSRDLWETRIKHISGQTAIATAEYSGIRLAGTPDPLLSPADQALNAYAADEAYYWTAQSQFAEAEYAAAVATLDQYIEEGGARSDEAAGLRVLCLAADGRTQDAAEAVAKLPETTAGLPRLKWLARRWTTPAADGSR
jgi:hypothetical protein